MGVFLYSTKKVNTEKIKEVFVSRGHKNIKVVQIAGQNLVYASKVFVDNVNYLDADRLGSNDKSDFIIGIGTFVYKGDYKEEALKAVWQDMDVVLRDNPVFGHWAFIVKKGNKTYVINDMNGALRLFVVNDNEGITVTSSLTAAYSSIESPKFDRVRLGAFLASGYGNEIPFVEGVESLDPMKYIVIEEGKSAEWINKTVPEAIRIETLAEAVPYVKSLFKKQMDVLKEAFGDERVSIELTAGLDSRLIASNLKSAGFNYDFLNYPLYGPDKEISTQIAHGLGKRLLVQTNIPLTGDIEQHFGEFDYGNNFFRQYANPRWIVEDKIQFSGARGECLNRPGYLTEDDIKNPKNICVERLISRLCLKKEMTQSCQKAYKSYLIEFFENRGYDVNKKMNEYEQMQFNQTLYGELSGDYMYNSGVQAHIYFVQIFNEWHFNHFVLNIATEAKMGRQLTIALIKEIDRELGSYPYVSHRRIKGKSVNESKELPKKHVSNNSIKKVIPDWIVDMVYKMMGRTVNIERVNKIDFDLYNDVIDVKTIVSHPNLYSSILNRLSTVEVLRKIIKIQ